MLMRHPRGDTLKAVVHAEVELEFCGDSAGLEWLSHSHIWHLIDLLVGSFPMRRNPPGPLQVDHHQQGNWTSYMVRAHKWKLPSFLKARNWHSAIPIPSY